MNVRQVVPFLRVADMERSLHFYGEGLGFESETDVPEDTKLSELA